MKLTDAQLAFVTRVAGKLNEKSSVYGYLSVLIGAFVGKQYDGLLQSVAAVIALLAGVTLFALSDASVRKLLTGQKPAAPYTVTVPPPQEG